MKKWIPMLVLAGFLAAVGITALILSKHYSWNELRRDLEARGETLDFEQLLPPPIPDEVNFAKSPLMLPYLQEPPTKSPLDGLEIKSSDSPPKTPPKGLPEPFPAQAWLDCLVKVGWLKSPTAGTDPAHAIIDGVRADHPELAEHSAELRVRKDARWPIDLANPLATQGSYYLPMMNAANACRLLGRAAAARQDSATALEAIHDLQRIEQCMSSPISPNPHRRCPGERPHHG